MRSRIETFGVLVPPGFNRDVIPASRQAMREFGGVLGDPTFVRAGWPNNGPDVHAEMMPANGGAA